jgi:probable F420-dependent oxidoreductase
MFKPRITRGFLFSYSLFTFHFVTLYFSLPSRFPYSLVSTLTVYLPMKLDAALPPRCIERYSRHCESRTRDRLRRAVDSRDPARSLPALHVDRGTFCSMDFGTAIAVSFARSPANLAYTAWDLAAQSGGRFILGLGTQVKAHIERRFGMTWPESVTGKLREQIQVIRAFWDTWQNGTKLNFRGEHYKITLMSPFFNPGAIENPNIPIYIAGVNTGLAKLAGEMCEGFHAHPFNSPRYMNEVILPAIEEGLQKSGRKRSDISISMTPFMATTPEEVGFARMQIAFYASTPSYKAVMDLHGWGETAETTYLALQPKVNGAKCPCSSPMKC